MNSKDIKELASIADVYISAPDCLTERQWGQLIDGLIELKSQRDRLVELARESIRLLNDNDPDSLSCRNLFCGELELMIAEAEGRIALTV